MTISFGVALLAAGQGKRLNLKYPKPLAPIVGKCLMDFPIEQSIKFLRNEKIIKSSIVAIVGHKKELVEKKIDSISNILNKEIETVFQEHQWGTADALKTYFEKNSNTKTNDYTLVICADTPLIRQADLSILYKEL